MDLKCHLGLFRTAVMRANFDLWGVAEKRRKKKKEKKEKERKKKVFTLKIRFQNYTFF